MLPWPLWPLLLTWSLWRWRYCDLQHRWDPRGCHCARGHCDPYGHRRPYRRHGMSSCRWPRADCIAWIVLWDHIMQLNRVDCIPASAVISETWVRRQRLNVMRRRIDRQNWLIAHNTLLLEGLLWRIGNRIDSIVALRIVGKHVHKSHSNCKLKCSWLLPWIPRALGARSRSWSTIPESNKDCAEKPSELKFSYAKPLYIEAEYSGWTFVLAIARVIASLREAFGPGAGGVGVG